MLPSYHPHQVRGQLANAHSSSGGACSFRVLADTTRYPTAAGCGVATVDAQANASTTPVPAHCVPFR